MTRRAVLPGIVRSLGPESTALQHLMAAQRTGRDPAPAIAEAILEKGFLENVGQAEVYRWIRYMWPAAKREQICRAYRIASELFAVDFLEEVG